VLNIKPRVRGSESTAEAVAGFTTLRVVSGVDLSGCTSVMLRTNAVSESRELDL
jgi:hypothetical protein